MTGVFALAMVAFISVVKRVLTEISIGVMVTFFQGARSTMRVASGSNHQLNSRRASMAPGSIAPLSAYKSAAHHDEFLGQRGDLGVELQRQRKIGQRAACPQHHFARILVHHLHDEFRRGAGSGLNVGRAFLHRRNDVGRVVGLVVDGGAIGFESVSPASLVFKLAVQGFPALGFFLGIEQGEFGALDHRDVGALGNLQHAQHVLRLFFHPLVAADRGDAENVKFVRLQENQNGLLVAGSGPAGVLVDDDFDFLGGGGDSRARAANEDCKTSLFITTDPLFLRRFFVLAKLRAKCAAWISSLDS